MTDDERELADLRIRDQVRDDSLRYMLHLIRKLWRNETLKTHETEAILRILDEDGSGRI